MTDENESAAAMAGAGELAACGSSAQTLSGDDSIKDGTHMDKSMQPLLQKDELKESINPTTLESETSDGDSAQLTTTTTENSELSTDDQRSNGQRACSQNSAVILIRRISRTHSDGPTTALPADDSRSRPPTGQQSRKSILDESEEYVVPCTTRSRDDRPRMRVNQPDHRTFEGLFSRRSILQRDTELSAFQIFLRKRRIELIALPLVLIVTVLFAFVLVQFVFHSNTNGDVSPRPEVLGPAALAFGVFVGMGVSAVLIFYLVTQFKILRSKIRRR